MTLAATREFAALVTIGRIVKPQGRKGEVAVEPLSDRPDRFSSLREVYVPGPDGGSRLVRVMSSWPHKGRFVLKLEGVDSISEAEAYRGLELRIGEEELASLPEGSYYHHQLKGLAVEDTEGKALGVVADILGTGAGAPVLVIRGSKGETLIPLVASFVLKVDLPGARMVVSFAD